MPRGNRCHFFTWIFGVRSSRRPMHRHASSYRMILVEPDSAWLQRQWDHDFHQQVEHAFQAAQPQPLPSTLASTPSPWDEPILEHFTAHNSPSRIASVATMMAKHSRAVSRTERREAWCECIRRIGEFIRAGVLTRVGRHETRLNEAYRPKTVVQPIRRFVA